MTSDTGSVVLAWDVVNTAICGCSLLCSMRTSSVLVPLRPWQSTRIRLRCLLVLLMALADVAFAIVTLTSSSLVLLRTPKHTPLCQLLGPLFDFSVFAVYIAVANLAHYSLWRLSCRSAEGKVALRDRYLCCICGGGFLLSMLVEASMLASEKRWQLGRGMCEIPGVHVFGVYVMNTLGRICEAYALCTLVLMARRAAKYHNPRVVWAQQRVSAGYILVAVVQGMVWWVPWLFSLVSGVTLSSDVANFQFSFGLAWPVYNYMVFASVSNLGLWADREQIEASHAAASIKAVGFANADASVEAKDNAVWRDSQQALMHSRIAELGQQLHKCIQDVMSDNRPDSFAHKSTTRILSTHSLEEVAVLIADLEHLSFVLEKLWEERV